MRATGNDLVSTAEPMGLYVHFPWCAKKCPYCDFNSHPMTGEVPERAYLDALTADIQACLTQQTRPLRSVFFGGGTPSLFSASAFTALLTLLRPWLADAAEITMEANPGTIEHRDLSGYRAAGINRISFGAQSFNPRHLQALGRIHNVQDIESSFAKARKAGFTNINLDVMYGLPEQTTAQALADLEQALRLGPEHVSWYQLTIEPKTPFARRPPRLATEQSIAEMETLGRELLASAGFERYEISAYARDGYRCWHNENYWRFGDYHGVGAGAHGKVSRGNTITRTRKALAPSRYMFEPTATTQEPVAADGVIFEFMLNALRLREGVPFQTFTQATGLGRGALEPLWSQLVSADLVQPERVAASELGYTHLDTVIQRFLD